MAKNFFEIPVASIVQTTPECSVLTFDVSEALKAKFAYKQGQYLTLKAMINGEELRRSYSLCSSPIDDKWQVAVKKIEDGRFSTFANEVLKAGDVIEVMPPNGRFFVEVDQEAERNYVVFAAGSGITPILSIIKTHLHLEPNSTFKLFYTSQTVQSIILKEEVEALKNIFLDRFEVFYFLTQEERDIPLFNGRINEDKLNIIFKHLANITETDEYFICGPEEMILMIKDFLIDRNVNQKQIHFELFNTSVPKNGVKKQRKTKAIADKISDVTILEGGKSFNFKIPQGSINILDAALNKSADLPFACKGGVCCTCRAKLIEGNVEMDVHYGLEQEEIDAGYVLTCRAVPTSEKVIVDFDS